MDGRGLVKAGKNGKRERKRTFPSPEIEKRRKIPNPSLPPPPPPAPPPPEAPELGVCNAAPALTTLPRGCIILKGSPPVTGSGEVVPFGEELPGARRAAVEGGGEKVMLERRRWET